VAFSAFHTMIRCWASYCLPGYWQDLGAMFQGPAAVANTNGQVHAVTRTALEMMHRARQ